MTDEAVFSSTNDAPYVIDGAFLCALADRIVEVAASHGCVEIAVKARMKRRAGDHGSMRHSADDVRTLLAQGHERIDAFEIGVHASAPPDGDRFYASIDLNPSSSDFLYANGPAAPAHAAHETMRAAMAARAALVEADQDHRLVRLGAEHPELARRIAAQGRSGRVIPLWPFCLAAYVVLLSGITLSRSPKEALAWAGGIVCLMALGWSLSRILPTRRRARAEAVRREADAAGFPMPDARTRPLRIIDVSHGSPTDAPRLTHHEPRLTYGPTVPFVI